MRALVQRVTEAAVRVDGQVCGTCGKGLLVLLGVAPTDDETTAERLWNKVRQLRIFEDEQGKMNRSLTDVGGSVLVVSQFTLYADCRRGNRPSFAGAAGPEQGNLLYERFCSLAEADVPCGRGIFGADMQVSLVNDGPVTIWLDTDDLSRSRRG
jgi:D-tyrosyl-tRNA(Tyr) deacylase